MNSIHQYLSRLQCVVLSVGLLLTGAAGPAAGQTTLTGQILDENGNPLSPANARLMVAADSTLAAGTISQEDGRFTIEQIAPGSYRLLVTMIGYSDNMSDVLTLSGEGTRDLGTISLLEATAELEELSVEARRNLIDRQGDRMVVNVGNSLSLAGTTALEVLERSPGVIVNEQSGTVSMLGKDGVRVMINGRQTQVRAEDLVQYLKGISSENIESIELITAPPADLEAEGNAGFININLGRSQNTGLSGSVSAGGGYGEGEVGNGSTNVTYRQDGFRLRGSYSFYRFGQFQQISNHRRIRGAEDLRETSTTTNRYPLRHNHNLRVALDYETTGAATVGAVVGAYNHRWTMEAHNRMLVRKDETPHQRVRSVNDEINQWRHLMSSLHASRDLGGGRLRAQLDYVYYHNNNPTTYHNTSTNLPSGSDTKKQFESRKTTPLRIYVGKIDYEASPADNLELKTGLKGSFARFTNRTRFEGLVESSWISAAGLRSTSHLQEDVLAAYGTTTYRWAEALSMEAGLRYEFTGTNLSSTETQNLVDRRFGRLFPSVNFSHQLGENQKLNLSYTRRITRPSFRDMAPFLYFLDPRTFWTGNVGLRPALINTVKLGGTYNDLHASAEYAWENRSIIRENRFLPEENVQIGFPTNLDQSQTATGLVTMPLHPTDWWTMQNDATVTWTKVRGLGEEKPAEKTQTTFRINSTQNVSLPEGFKLELSGFYQTGSLWGLRSMKPIGKVDLALQRGLPGGAGRLTLSVNDAFDSHEWRVTRGSPRDRIYIEQRYDMGQRSVELTYSLRFGGGGETDMPTTASEEERQRADN